jgi:hypothetical protein
LFLRDKILAIDANGEAEERKQAMADFKAQWQS